MLSRGAAGGGGTTLCGSPSSRSQQGRGPQRGQRQCHGPWGAPDLPGPLQRVAPPPSHAGTEPVRELTGRHTGPGLASPRSERREHRRARHREARRQL